MYQNSEKSQRLLDRLQVFFDENIYPNEQAYAKQLHGAQNRFAALPLMDELKSKAKAAGLWNLFVPPSHGKYCEHGGLSFAEYAPLCELMGRVIWSPEVFNCNAPDTGNMEVFMNYATKDQQDRWLKPLLSGEIRSSYAMTEPQVASSDATNVEMSIVKEGNEWVLNGRKWFITGAMNERTRILIVMGKSDPSNPNRHLQQTQVLVPKDTTGLTLVRPLTTFGYDDAPIGHAELVFENCRVPLENVLLGEGRGFEIAQGRLGPGRMHHCMRLIGTGQRSLELACQRTVSRTTFGRQLSKHQSVREDISRMFSEIEMARLLVLKTCHQIDDQGVSASIDMIAATKTTVPVLMQSVIDRAIQMHGAGGLTEDYCMAEGYNYARWCRQADGPDQVHQMALGKQVIERYSGEKA
ncbi:MAG: acyl-CoA dehydrogenase [Porticoccaceae bacterium]|nr:acyl-CoA dehydrogenase [Porticoccaceae bacterium]MBT3797454.1 acyl-CoA dehydrogenase [Porticoccaceae bacterium]MBT4211140.1 acyl-CoA dehydrogenase [Porticoccaceae bacterium]MBT4591572.1 acyl-CoA dehydrogenase [Porticoccaceae bacterium]MBT5104454.1 acyl-CoA dehydrogenase [Porticoccaceae bacterium]